MAGYCLQPRVAAAENMRYEENKKNPGIKAEKTILHDGEVEFLRLLSSDKYYIANRPSIMPPHTAAPA